MQIFLIAVIVAVILGQSQTLLGANAANNGPLLIMMMIAAAAEFAIARVQDYILAGLIGLLASLLVPTRQAAATTALMAALAIILVRAVITALFIAMLPAMTLTTMLLLLPVGPSSAVVFAVSLPFAILFLVAMILVREAAIRFSFRWLLAHLADGEPNDAVQSA
jgi:hypothetical protein